MLLAMKARNLIGVLLGKNVAPYVPSSSAGRHNFGFNYAKVALFISPDARNSE